MEFPNQPYFTILEIARDNNEEKIIGVFSDLNGVANGYAYLFTESRKIIKGKISDLKLSDKKAVFVSAEEQTSTLLAAGQQCMYFDGYLGERVAIIFDTSRNWRKILFEPSESTRINKDGSVKVVKGGWDHEHCVIDQKNISLHENPFGYKDQFGTWVCVDCYNNYVLTKKFGFIKSG